MITRWQPWQEMEAARRQFDQLFNEMTATRETAWTPAIELTATDADFTVRAQLPGIDAKDVDVEIGRNAIAISGEHKFEQKTDEKGYFRSEFRYGKFRRVLALPAAVQNDQAKAEFKDGILTLTVPRVQAVKPSVVKLNLGGAPEAALAPEAAPEAQPQTEAAPEAQAETQDAWNN